MNMNFFNPRKTLRTFQGGGSMPQRSDFNSDEEYALAMEVYAMPSNRQPMERLPLPTPTPMPGLKGPGITSVNLPSITTPQQLVSSNYKGDSIVDYLKSIGQDSSKANRRKLAALSGDADYDMSGSDNTALLDYLRNNPKGTGVLNTTVSAPRTTTQKSSNTDNSGPLMVGSEAYKRKVLGLSPKRNSDDARFAADADKRLGMYRDAETRAKNSLDSVTNEFNRKKAIPTGSISSFNSAKYRGGLPNDIAYDAEKYGTIGKNGIEYTKGTGFFDRLSNKYSDDVGGSFLSLDDGDRRNPLLAGADKVLTSLFETGFVPARTLTGNARGAGDYLQTALTALPFLKGAGKALGKKANSAINIGMVNKMMKQLPPSSMAALNAPATTLALKAPQLALPPAKITKLQKLYNKQMKSSLRFDNE